MKKSRKNRLRWSRDQQAVLFFLGPSLLGFLVFYLIPFIAGFYYSMVDSPIGGRFVGLANYSMLLNNPVFQRAAGNTLLFTIISVPLIMGLSLVFALLLNQNVHFRNFFRTALVTPLVVPVASVVLVWTVLFDSRGALNGIINAWGCNSVDWMNTCWARVVVLVVYLWKNLGYNMILFLAGLQNIPSEYYESAEIDGAGPWKKFTNITLVHLTPTSFFVFIMSIINSFKVFRETFLIAGPYPHESIYILQHYMNNTFMSLDYQKLTTAAVLMALIIYLLVLGLFLVERKISESIGT